MILNKGLDSASSCTLAQAQAAKAAGYSWWGFYLPKEPNTDPLNSWTVDQMNILVQAGIVPIPICIPSPPHPADPVATATEYFNLAKQYGLDPILTTCYNGEGIVVNGSVWLPRPSPTPPTAVGSQSAIQWFTGNFEGLNVDFSVSAPDFPLNTLVCDLEHNTSYTSAWYQTFQQTVADLAAVPPIPQEILMSLPYVVVDETETQWFITPQMTRFPIDTPANSTGWRTVTGQGNSLPEITAAQLAHVPISSP